MLENKNRFDKLFKNVSPTSMSGIQIFGIHDKYIKPQKYNDVTNAFKAYKKELLIEFTPIVSKHFNINAELSLKAISAHR